MISIVRVFVLIGIVLTVQVNCFSAEVAPHRQRTMIGIRSEVGSLGLTFGKTHTSMYSLGLSVDYLSSPRNTIGGTFVYQQYASYSTPDFTLSGSAVELSINAKYFPINTLRDSAIAPYICGGTSFIIGTQDATFPTIGGVTQKPLTSIMFLQTLSPSLGVMIPIGKKWFINLEAKFTLGYGIAREISDTDAGIFLYSEPSYTIYTQVSGIGGICIFL